MTQRREEFTLKQRDLLTLPVIICTKQENSRRLDLSLFLKTEDQFMASIICSKKFKCSTVSQVKTPLFLEEWKRTHFMHVCDFLARNKNVYTMIEFFRNRLSQTTVYHINNLLFCHMWDVLLFLMAQLSKQRKINKCAAEPPLHNGYLVDRGKSW